MDERKEGCKEGRYERRKKVWQEREHGRDKKKKEGTEKRRRDRIISFNSGDPK